MSNLDLIPQELSGTAEDVHSEDFACIVRLAETVTELAEAFSPNTFDLASHTNPAVAAAEAALLFATGRIGKKDLLQVVRLSALDCI